MIWFLSVPLLALLALLQTTIFRQILFLDGNLDLLLVAVICWSMLRPEEGLAWAALAGLFADLFSGGPFGITAIAYLLVAICHRSAARSALDPQPDRGDGDRAVRDRHRPSGNRRHACPVRPFPRGWIPPYLCYLAHRVS